MSSLELPMQVSSARLVSPLPAHLQCSSCPKPLFNAFQTPHGCRLCQPCVTGLLHPVEKRRCPGNTEACRDLSEEIEVSQATCFPDMATRREVTKLRVRCPNCDTGCPVQLTWALMDQHVQDSCEFHTLGCELCNQQIMKKDMQRHTSRECRQRKETCDLCSQLVTVCEMETRHRNLESDVCCPRFSAHCPHCGNRRKKLDRRNYVAHLSECPEKPVDCKYSHLGCTAKIRRSDVEKHYREDSDSHVTLLDMKLRQIGTASPASQSQIVASPSRTQELSELKRRTECVYEAFKKMQINVANWTHTMLEFEQVADRFGGVSQMRESLQSYSDRARQLQNRRAPRGSDRFANDGSLTSSAVPPTQDTLQPQLQQLFCSCLFASGGAMQVNHPVCNSCSADCPVRPLNQPKVLLSGLVFGPGHTGRVTHACCFPGNRQIAASGGADGAVVLWDLDCMRQLMRVQARPNWGPITNLVALTTSILVASWTNRNGLVRLSCQKLEPPARQTELLDDLLRTGDAELLESNSPPSVISAVPESSMAMIAFADCSFSLVSAGGSLGPLFGCTHPDPMAGPPVFLQILEQGIFLIRQLHSPRIHSAQLCTAQEGPVIIVRWRSVDHLDVETTGAASAMQACMAGDVPRDAFLVFQCQMPGRISAVQLGPDFLIHPVVTRFMAHTKTLTAICLLRNGHTSNLSMLATASADGEICVWRLQTRPLANQFVKVSYYAHSNEVTMLLQQLSDNGQLKLLVGDAQGNFFCLQSTLLSAG